MNDPYVDYRDEGYWVSSTRVSLESVLFLFLDGFSPETIAAECFPTLTLEQVYGSITFYLSNRDKINSYLRQSETGFVAFQNASHDADFSRKMMKARREMQLIHT